MFPSNSKFKQSSTKIIFYQDFSKKNFLKSMNVSSFYRNKPIIWQTFNALFSKGIDMTRLYILMIFDIKKDSQIDLKLPHTLQEKKAKTL